jgi:hypothetical protein
MMRCTLKAKCYMSHRSSKFVVRLRLDILLSLIYPFLCSLAGYMRHKMEALTSMCTSTIYVVRSFASASFKPHLNDRWHLLPEIHHQIFLSKACLDLVETRESALLTMRLSTLYTSAYILFHPTMLYIQPFDSDSFRLLDLLL